MFHIRIRVSHNITWGKVHFQVCVCVTPTAIQAFNHHTPRNRALGYQSLGLKVLLFLVPSFYLI